MYAQDEVIDLLTPETMSTFGGLCSNGASLMIDEAGSSGENEADHWTIFGDPSVQVRTDSPFTMMVAHDNQIDPNNPTFEVVVTGIEGALAAVSWDGQLFGSAYTNAQGLASIQITPGTLPPGYVDLTVTAFNAMPYVVQLPVVSGGPDTWPPLIAHTPLVNTISAGPYEIEATIMDYSGVLSASLWYATDGINFAEVVMTNTIGDTWVGDIPGQGVGTTIDYYLEATDASPQFNTGNTDTYSFLILGVLFSDNMEAGMGNWTHEELLPTWLDQWHYSTENSHSPSHSWKFGVVGGNYGDLAYGALYSEVINVGDMSELTFWHRMSAEVSGAYADSAYDGGCVEISHNGGPWALLDLPYTHHTRAEAGSGNPYTGPFDPATPVFSGSFNWTEATADLSAYIGDIQLRFVFGSDGASNEEGWYIDDVMIIGLPSGTLPDVQVTLTPYGTPIQIPGTGGSFDYNIAVANNDPVAQTFDVWVDITLPNGSTYGPVIGPVNLTMDPSTSIDRDRTQAVPAVAPAGNYTVNAFAGVYPGAVWSADAFPFEKLTTGDGAIVSGWNNYGEEFTQWLTNPPAEVVVKRLRLSC
jgi:hypothetical protein